MNLMEEARALQDEVVEIRRTLHRHPELGFDLPLTLALVKEKLTEYGYEPVDCGKAGVVATVGKPGKTILLRADMDALPMREDTDVPFKSENSWMHSCGHDLHTAMLLGAAKLLKAHEDELCGTVKLMFQPAEEILGGAKDMVENGVLENPKVDVAFGMHNLSTAPAGKIVYADRYVNASADKFVIHINGKGGHGAHPEQCYDPVLTACLIGVALQELTTREIEGREMAILTIGHMEAGDKENIIPASAMMEGTTRTYNNEVRMHLRKRIPEVVSGIAAAYRCEGTVEWPFGVAPNENDPDLQKEIIGSITEFLGAENVITREPDMGSEDFSYVAQKVPSVYVSLGSAVEDPDKVYMLHSNKVVMNEECLSTGVAVYAYTAIEWLKNHA